MATKDVLYFDFTKTATPATPLPADAPVRGDYVWVGVRAGEDAGGELVRVAVLAAESPYYWGSVIDTPAGGVPLSPGDQLQFRRKNIAGMAPRKTPRFDPADMLYTARGKRAGQCTREEVLEAAEAEKAAAAESLRAAAAYRRMAEQIPSRQPGRRITHK